MIDLYSEFCIKFNETNFVKSSGPTITTDSSITDCSESISDEFK